ncbi:MAG: class I SAM-dependent methyltransferase [Pseudomonadota bacterium]
MLAILGAYARAISSPITMTNINPKHRHSTTASRFDAAYYQRYYRDPKTRAGTPASAKRQAAFVAGYLNHLEVPVRSVIDFGCGLGRTLRALGRCYPKARTQGIEYSDYLCRRYGWLQSSIADYRGPVADLVVCVDVLSYLGDDECSRALQVLARSCNTAALISVVTAEDRTICDFDRTDRAQHMRPARWYRRRLHRHFEPLGGGLYLKKPLPVNLWTLDRR